MEVLDGYVLLVLMHLLAPVLSDMEQWVSSNAFLKVIMHLLALGAF